MAPLTEWDRNHTSLAWTLVPTGYWLSRALFDVAHSFLAARPNARYDLSATPVTIRGGVYVTGGSALAPGAVALTAGAWPFNAFAPDPAHPTLAPAYTASVTTALENEAFTFSGTGLSRVYVSNFAVSAVGDAATLQCGTLALALALTEPSEDRLRFSFDASYGAQPASSQDGLHACLQHVWNSLEHRRWIAAVRAASRIGASAPTAFVAVNHDPATGLPATAGVPTSVRGSFLDVRLGTQLRAWTPFPLPDLRAVAPSSDDDVGPAPHDDHHDDPSDDDAYRPSDDGRRQRDRQRQRQRERQRRVAGLGGAADPAEGARAPWILAANWFPGPSEGQVVEVLAGSPVLLAPACDSGAGGSWVTPSATVVSFRQPTVPRTASGAGLALPTASACHVGAWVSAWSAGVFDLFAFLNHTLGVGTKTLLSLDTPGLDGVSGNVDDDDDDRAANPTASSSAVVLEFPVLGPLQTWVRSIFNAADGSASDDDADIVRNDDDDDAAWSSADPWVTARRFVLRLLVDLGVPRHVRLRVPRTLATVTASTNVSAPVTVGPYAKTSPVALRVRAELTVPAFLRFDRSDVPWLVFASEQAGAFTNATLWSDTTVPLRRRVQRAVAAWAAALVNDGFDRAVTHAEHVGAQQAGAFNRAWTNLVRATGCSFATPRPTTLACVFAWLDARFVARVVDPLRVGTRVTDDDAAETVLSTLVDTAGVQTLSVHSDAFCAAEVGVPPLLSSQATVEDVPRRRITDTLGGSAASASSSVWDDLRAYLGLRAEYDTARRSWCVRTETWHLDGAWQAVVYDAAHAVESALAASLTLPGSLVGVSGSVSGSAVLAAVDDLLAGTWLDGWLHGGVATNATLFGSWFNATARQVEVRAVAATRFCGWGSRDPSFANGSRPLDSRCLRAAEHSQANASTLRRARSTLAAEVALCGSDGLSLLDVARAWYADNQSPVSPRRLADRWGLVAGLVDVALEPTSTTSGDVTDDDGDMDDDGGGGGDGDDDDGGSGSWSSVRVQERLAGMDAARWPRLAQTPMLAWPAQVESFSTAVDVEETTIDSLAFVYDRVRSVVGTQASPPSGSGSTLTAFDYLVCRVGLPVRRTIPSPSPTPSPTPSASPTASTSPSVSPSPSPSPSPSVSPSITPTPTRAPTPTSTPSSSPTPSRSATPSPSTSASALPSPSPGGSPAASASPFPPTVIVAVVVDIAIGGLPVEIEIDVGFLIAVHNATVTVLGFVSVEVVVVRSARVVRPDGLRPSDAASASSLVRLASELDANHTQTATAVLEVWVGLANASTADDVAGFLNESFPAEAYAAALSTANATIFSDPGALTTRVLGAPRVEPVEWPSPTPNPEAPWLGRHWGWALGVGLGVVVLAFGLWFVLWKGYGRRTPGPKPSSHAHSNAVDERDGVRVARPSEQEIVTFNPTAVAPTASATGTIAASGGGGVVAGAGGARAGGGPRGSRVHAARGVRGARASELDVSARSTRDPATRAQGNGRDQ